MEPLAVHLDLVLRLRDERRCGEGEHNW
jgi:hypothetical protein